MDDGTFRSLVEMGIDSTLARAAAARFSSADAAVNWCFGEGANVRSLSLMVSRPVHLQEAFGGQEVQDESELICILSGSPSL